IDATPSALRSGPMPPIRIPARGPLSPQLLPHTAAEWVMFQVAQSEKLLWNKGCKLCHTIIFGNDPLPQVARSDIPQRWLPNADFSHDAHRMMSCTSCHSRAPSSRQTADVLLPSIQTCRQCHLELGSRAQAAEGRCFECHVYHKWNNEQPGKGKFDIPPLRAGF